eukprot:TRINITY_DN915_c0_g1_i3.p1 TRINITY_DN915_c0_g1~~TRINITY_DN915_c0_g1_i3.p1  ORF type:complete len:134 (-),score=10.62 TRINITY_DN915_c0_g1_i3:178-549(-)
MQRLRQVACCRTGLPDASMMPYSTSASVRSRKLTITSNLCSPRRANGRPTQKVRYHVCKRCRTLLDTHVPGDLHTEERSHFTRSRHSHIMMLLPRITTIPISFFSVGFTISTVLSRTMFMNWS